MKQCNICGKLKPQKEFFTIKRPDLKKGYTLSAYCRPCSALKTKMWRKNNREKVREYDRRNWKLNSPFRKRKYQLKYFIRYAYNNILLRTKYSSKRPKEHKYLGMSVCDRSDFYTFAYKSKILKNLYRDWIKSGHVHKLIPTVDRIDNNKGYGLDNIQFLTLSENARKGAFERFNKTI